MSNHQRDVLSLFFPPLASLFLLAVVSAEAVAGDPLQIQQDEAAGTIKIYRIGDEVDAGPTATLILTQHARPDFRPYLHPLQAPDGQGQLTQYSPAHHRHQTGIYWGFTRVNGRDYFHHPEGDYWRRVAVQVLQDDGEQVQWQTVYDLLDESGEPLLTETVTWSLKHVDAEYWIDLQWSGRGQAGRDNWQVRLRRLVCADAMAT